MLHCPHLLTVPADVEVCDDRGAGQREHLVVGVARHAARSHQQRRRHEAERGVQDGALKYFWVDSWNIFRLKSEIFLG